MQYELVLLMEGVPGIIAILLLLAIGNFKREDLYLRWKKPSRTGLLLTSLLLGIMALGLLISIFGLGFGSYSGFSPISFCIIAPLSGITQELYFRSSLQVIFEKNHKE